MNGKAPAMPPEIAKAVIQVMMKVETLQKANPNAFENFMYASVDQFFKMMRPLCAEANLFIYPIEVDQQREVFENRSGNLNIIAVTYEFMLAHSSGATWQHPSDRRTIRLQFKGAQTTGMAQSYAIKQFMRSLFQIETGEKDADSEEQDQIANANAIADKSKEEKAKGKLAGKTIAFRFSDKGRPEALAPPDIVKRARETLSEWPVDQRLNWMTANNVAMQELHKLSMNDWLEVKKIVEAA